MALRHYVPALTEMIALSTFPATIGFALSQAKVFRSYWAGNGLEWSHPCRCFVSTPPFASIVCDLAKSLTACGNPRFSCGLSDGTSNHADLFLDGSHWGLRGIAFGWVLAIRSVAIAEY